MTPRRLDWQSIQPKLAKIRELLDRLESFGHFDEARLRSDEVQTLAAERILTLVVDLAFAINSHVAVVELGRPPDTYADSFGLAGATGMISVELAAQLAPSAGMRNILVHDYLEVDYARIALAVPMAIDGYGEYVEQVAAWLLKRNPPAGPLNPSV